MEKVKKTLRISNVEKIFQKKNLILKKFYSELKRLIFLISFNLIQKILVKNWIVRKSFEINFFNGLCFFYFFQEILLNNQFFLLYIFVSSPLKYENREYWRSHYFEISLFDKDIGRFQFFKGTNDERKSLKKNKSESLGFSKSNLKTKEIIHHINLLLLRNSSLLSLFHSPGLRIQKRNILLAPYKNLYRMEWDEY